LKTIIGVMGVCWILVNVPSQVEAQDHIRLRLGASPISGFYGLEYQRNNTALDLGYFGSDNFGSDKGRPRITIGARYFLDPTDEANGEYAGMSFLLNYRGRWEDDRKLIYDFTNGLFLIAGYRWTFGGRFDLTLGGGCGVELQGAKYYDDSLQGTGELTLGIAIK